MIFDLLFNDKKNRDDERMRILELRIKRLEQLQQNPNNAYVVNPAGIRWHYHHIDGEGNIIEKK